MAVSTDSGAVVSPLLRALMDVIGYHHHNISNSAASTTPESYLHHRRGGKRGSESGGRGEGARGVWAEDSGAGERGGARVLRVKLRCVEWNHGNGSISAQAKPSALQSRVINNNKTFLFPLSLLSWMLSLTVSLFSLALHFICVFLQLFFSCL